MSDAKHTPGPWIVRQFQTFRGATNQYWVLDSIPDSDGKVIANAVCSIAMTNEDAEANARLIAKAPEMFELLRSILLHEETNGIGDELGRDRGLGTSLDCSPKLRKWLNDASTLYMRIKGEF